MNKVAVITGATKGIGRALAEKFSDEGFDLALCARTEGELYKLHDELQPKGIKILAQVCDVSNKEEVKEFGSKVLEVWGSAEVLVNNAGIFFPGQVINESEATLEKLIETNLYSAYNLSRTLVPKMIETKRGHIFNISSVAGIKEYPNGGSYSISKFALLGFSKALRLELKESNVRVTVLMPGATYTESWASSGLPESRFMKSSDIAKLVWDIYNLSESTVVEEVVLRPMLGDI